MKVVFDSFDYFQLAQFDFFCVTRPKRADRGHRASDGVHGHNRPSYRALRRLAYGPLPSVNAAADRLLTDQSEP